MSNFINRYSTLLPLGGALAFAGLASYIFYKLFQKDEEDLPPEVFPVVKLSTCELKLPRSTVGAVIGRQGFNIKQIESKTSTLIKFKEDCENNNNRICVIRGKIEKVEKAKELILLTVKNVPVIEEEKFNIPAVAVGPILGRNGKILDKIQRNSGAKLSLKFNKNTEVSLENEKTEFAPAFIYMKGTKDQIKTAKLIIFEKIEEDKRVREMIKDSVGKLSQRSKYYKMNEEKKVEEGENVTYSDSCDGLSSYMAFVSAVASACHFWVQMLGPKLIELDKLVEEMSEYYASPANREELNVFLIESGDIIAAKFVDGLWYRGRVCKYDFALKKLEIYFVDFGDMDEVDVDDVAALRTDFLKLSFQATECYLADVDFESCDTDEAIDVFEKISYCAQWKPVRIHVIGYKQEGDTAFPLVKMVDTSGEKEVNIAEELVSRNLIKWSGSKMASMASPISSEEPLSM